MQNFEKKLLLKKKKVELSGLRSINPVHIS